MERLFRTRFLVRLFKILSKFFRFFFIRLVIAVHFPALLSVPFLLVQFFHLLKM